MKHISFVLKWKNIDYTVEKNIWTFTAEELRIPPKIWDDSSSKKLENASIYVYSNYVFVSMGRKSVKMHTKWPQKLYKAV